MKLVLESLIKTNYYALDKRSCLDEMVDILFQNDIVSSQEIFLKAILDREKIISTGIGHKIAIPHGRSDSANEMKVAVFILKNDLEYDSIDGEPVRLIFMISVPPAHDENYMEILGAISNFCHSDENREKLMNASNPKEAYRILKQIEINID